MQWKWKNPPKKDALRLLGPEMVDVSQRHLRELAPAIARMIVSRLRTRSLLAHGGVPKPIPDYADSYKRRLTERGDSTRPDYTVTGTLLDHLSGKLTRRNLESVQLVIAPHGRCAHPSGKIQRKVRKGTKREGRKGYWWKPAYSYRHWKSNAVVNVPGHWVKMTPVNKVRSKKLLRYNAHLANRLSLRLGRGRWNKWEKIRSGEEELHSFITITHAELMAISQRMGKRREQAAKKLVRKVAGK